MTAKEKALNLCQRFGMAGLDSEQTEHYTLELSLAKVCALICVDEIINAIDWHEFETPNKEIEYWNEVKAEIEKL